VARKIWATNLAFKKNDLRTNKKNSHKRASTFKRHSVISVML